MSKKIHHMGMTITRDAHDEFHSNAAELSPEQHDRLMKKLRVTKEQDEEWHRTHLTLGQQRALAKEGMKAVNPVALGTAFVGWCVKQQWIISRGKEYYATPEGIRQLRSRFLIEIQTP